MGYTFYNFGGVLLFSIAAYAITRLVIVQVYEKCTTKARTIVRLINCCLVLVIVLLCVILLGDISKPPQVDITPLTQFAAKPFYDNDYLQDRFIILECTEGVYRTDFVSYSEPVNSDGLVGRGSYNMNNSDIPASISVSMYIYSCAEDAITLFNVQREWNLWKRVVKQFEDVDVLLCYSRTSRGVDTLYAYSGFRYENTYVRIGNIMINLYEEESNYTEIGALTSKNIKLICEVLLSSNVEQGG